MLKGELRALTKDAYEAPLIPTSAAGVDCQLNEMPPSTDGRALPACLPYAKRQPGPSPGVADDGSGGANTGR